MRRPICELGFQPLPCQLLTLRVCRVCLLHLEFGKGCNSATVELPFEVFKRAVLYDPKIRSRPVVIGHPVGFANFVRMCDPHLYERRGVTDACDFCDQVI